MKPYNTDMNESPAETKKDTPRIAEGEHLLGNFAGAANGPTLIVFGGLHGNEAAGVLAIKRVLPKLEQLTENLKGRVYLLAGNTRALNQGLRFLDADLNRHFTTGNVTRNLKNRGNIREDQEQSELLPILHDVLRSAKDEVYALDLHSTSADGHPFGTVGDTLRNRRFAQKFPITFLLGIEEQLEGTLMEYLNNLGVVTLGFEGGQHYSEKTIGNHEALIWLAIANSGCLRPEQIPDFESHFRHLANSSGKKRIIEIRYRHAITAEDEFEMNPGYENFQPVTEGEVLAKDRRGEVRATEKGMVLMPLYQKLGEDGFFLGREVARFWLLLSEGLRRLNVPALIGLLPGVKRHENEPGIYRIDTRIARFLPLQVSHLLGFRRRRWEGKNLVIGRRLYDKKGPFQNE